MLSIKQLIRATADWCDGGDFSMKDDEIAKLQQALKDQRIRAWEQRADYEKQIETLTSEYEEKIAELASDLRRLKQDFRALAEGLMRDGKLTYFGTPQDFKNEFNLD